MSYVSVDVSIDEFETKDLIDALSHRRVISERETKILHARKDKLPRDSLVNEMSLKDAEEDRQALLSECEWRARRGEFRDSLICLTRAFPNLEPLARLSEARS